MAGLLSLATAVSDHFLKVKDGGQSAVVLYSLKDVGEEDKDVPPPFVFQYFPENMQLTQPVEYASRNVFGGSLPIYQYISSGEQVISFSADFTSDVDFLDPSLDAGTISKLVEQDRNVDVRAALSWLNSMKLPRYDGLYTRPPRRLALYVPNSGLGSIFGKRPIFQDTVSCFMTECSTTIEAWFPSGLPRHGKVSLQFKVRSSDLNGVSFPSRAPGEARGVTGAPKSRNLPYSIRIK